MIIGQGGKKENRIKKEKVEGCEERKKWRWEYNIVALKGTHPDLWKKCHTQHTHACEMA